MPYSLEMFNPFSVSDARYNRALFGLPFVRNQNCYWFIDSLRGSLAKYTFRTLIPARNDTIKVLADNSIVTGFYDSRQPT